MQNTLQNSEKALAAFLDYEARGLRDKAKAAARALILSLPSLDDKDRWTRQNLQGLPINRHGCIRHEIYEDIILPALWARYEQNDPEAAFLLGTTWRNLVASRERFKRLGYISDIQLFESAHTAEPGSDRYRLAYFDAILRSFDYPFHEWPIGILIDHDNWNEDLARLKTAINHAASLDHEGRHKDVLKELLQRCDIYAARLAQKYT